MEPDSADPTAPRSPLTYADAGVDIDRGSALVERIGPAVKRTRRTGVMGGIGGFGGLFSLAECGFEDPVLVSGTDGVGTKLRLAVELQRHADIGIDLVAMCVNDVVVTGAEPLFFLDYYACGALDVDTAATVIGGIARGCEEAGAALLGGETAEMPQMYEGDDYDLAGFCVGAVERRRLIDGSRVAPGDRILGLASSGVHSNGYSLVRRILDQQPGARAAVLATDLAGIDLATRLLTPTRIYVKPLLELARTVSVHALAHITGGGITENLPRVLPAGTGADIDLGAWPLPPLFDWLRQAGPVDDGEMLRTFNCGVGMIAVVPAAAADAARDCLQARGETVYLLGEIVARDDDEGRVRYSGELG